MSVAIRWTSPPLRLMLGLFAAYAIVTVPSLLPRWGASPAGFVLLAAWIAIAGVAWPIAEGRISGRNFWLALAAVATLLRLAALPVALGRATAGDPMIYVALARQLLAGQGLLFHDPFTDIDFLALYPPGYPLLLAAIGSVLPLGPATILAGNLVVELATAALISRIGERLGNAGAGRAAAWLFATWPTFVLAAPFAQKESLVMLLALLQALALLRLRERSGSGWRNALALGSAAGAMALVQPALTLLPATLGLALLPAIGWRPLLLLGLKAAPIAAAVLLPWWIRNWAIFHQFVPLTSTGGLGLWIGNNPQSSGNFMPLTADFRGLSELGASAHGAAEAKRWILGHPAAFARLTATKLVRSAGVEQFTLTRFSLLRPAPPPSLLAALFPLLQGALFLSLAGSALLAGRVRRMVGGDWLLLLLLGAAIQIAGFGIWFEFGERHRYFIMPVLFLILGFGLESLVAARRLAHGPPVAPNACPIG